MRARGVVLPMGAQKSVAEVAGVLAGADDARARLVRGLGLPVEEELHLGVHPRRAADFLLQ